MSNSSSESDRSTAPASPSSPAEPDVTSSAPAETAGAASEDRLALSAAALSSRTSMRSLRRERRASRRRRMAELFRRFIRAEATGGMVLLVNTLIALSLAHSSLATWVAALWQQPIGIELSALRFHLTTAEWINDGLMALFFLLVGMEIKRELVQGELDSPRKAALPVIAAGFGMLVPALIYLSVSGLGGAEVRRGWAVPTATDIAFTVGVMALLGRRVPMGLRVFVTALAIADDLGAVLVIALFYSAKLHVLRLVLCAALTAGLLACNRLGVRKPRAYVVLGGLLWLAMLHSGIHATIAGVILGLCTPLSTGERFSRALQYPVALFVLPLFALCNAGVTLPVDAASLRVALSQPISVGVFLGLLLGKPLGIFTAAVLAVVLRVGQLPSGTRYPALLGAAMLCGIGFTMSIFTAQLAFQEATLLGQAKLGIFAGSLTSAIVGALMLRLTSRSSG